MSTGQSGSSPGSPPPTRSSTLPRHFSIRGVELDVNDQQPPWMDELLAKMGIKEAERRSDDDEQRAPSSAQHAIIETVGTGTGAPRPMIEARPSPPRPSPGRSSIGVAEAFRAADVNNDSRVSMDEWLKRPRPSCGRTTRSVRAARPRG